MSTTEPIPLGSLAARLDSFTKRFLRDESPEYVDVEVLLPDAGVYPSRRELPLVSASYDRRSNTLEFMFEQGDHRVYNPKEVRAASGADGFISAFEIIRDDGAREIVKVIRYARRRIRTGV